MDGADEDLRDIGFISSDDEIDLSEIRSSKKKTKKDDDEEEAPSLFGRLTSAF